MAARVSRDDGFDVMDVSTSIVNDPKFRRLQRHSPEHVAVGFMAYIATLGDSWKHGRRVAVADAWPVVLDYDDEVIAAMKSAGLLDGRGFIPAKAWDSWFRVAVERRTKARDRWTRYNAKREADTASLPRGNDVGTALPNGGANADTASSVPPVRPSSRPTVPPVQAEETKEIPPPPAERGRRSNRMNPRAQGREPRAKSTNPRATGTSVRQVRADHKRGPSKLHDILTKAAGIAADPA